MRVDGREIPVTGSLLQPLTRRTTDIVRVMLAALWLAVVIAASVITRPEWLALERSVSDIVGFLTPDQSNLVYLLYGVAILILPFAILIELVIGRQWKLLAGYAAAGLVAGLLLSITGTGLSAPQWHLQVPDRLDTFLSQFLDDPRWIAMLAAVLTVSSPWLPTRPRRWWWFLLLAFAPIHLVVSTVVPARAMFGLAVGWLVGALIVWVVGTPALEVPLEAAVRVLRREGHRVTGFTVRRPAGSGPLVLAAAVDGPERELSVELYGKNQRSHGALRMLWRWLTFRSSETAAMHGSMHRAVEHRALMAIAVGDLGLAGQRVVSVAALDRGWVLYAHTVAAGQPLDTARAEMLPTVWQALDALHTGRVAHGDLRPDDVRVDGDKVLFTGFGNAEFGATDTQLQTDIAQLLVTTTAIHGKEAAVAAAIATLGEQTVLTATRRLTKSAMPSGIRVALPEWGKRVSEAREEVRKQTGQDRIEADQITRFSRNQIIQLVLLIGLVYVAYPFISAVPTFFTQLRTANWWWALLGLAVSSLTYVGAAAALWACASGLVRMRDLVIMQIANTFAATTTPARVGGLALSVRFLQKGGLGAVRATAAVALQQAVQVITHVSLLVLFSIVAGTSADLSHFVPDPTIIYLAAGVGVGIIGTFMFVPKLRRWLNNSVRPQLQEVLGELGQLARDPKRFATIVGGCAAITLGMAGALWASVEAFGGGTTFVTVTIVTMIGGTLASAAPTPGGVGAVEAALIGGLAAFGLPADIAVPAVLLYRVLTCWLPVFCGWLTMRWMTAKDMI
ncbi:flippase-like domain-containing protein [Nocardia farcinica]|uniref:Integral membrane protein n=1 Tax=Nocardia farcinica TaxID=37329 RepID=A0A449GL79_NOCFR|nr:lysylphosphatidylglycerol synthase transmembrane domain-containing protein [Nocardia farcinica]MBF6419880.1 flippase-like domain-containing protein [Nocardia farcinica]MBF6431357.1 flippase-like domain-containing protein [Nocardia farcinica]MBF6442510.1 flippase-like domain-containing protein [Nocardia farcinica]MBF6505159.1 flippase-like domain-containing protein [Nocardia farcinica]MCZ9326245.1 lysylphosphatidylglycerol synthase transmembrane domain-containing protein [Nocardia farcinica]